MSAKKNLANSNQEQEAKEFLLTAGVLIIHRVCPWCGGGVVRHIRRDKFRCPKCKHEWGLRKGSILDGTKISFSLFIKILQLFTDDVPVNDTAQRLGIAYNTASEIYRRIRVVILQETWSRPIPGISSADMSDLSEKRADHKKGTILVKGLRVFSIRLKNDLVYKYPLNSADADIILQLPVPKVRRGSLLFIDAFGKTHQGFIAFIPDKEGLPVKLSMLMDNLPWSPISEFLCFTRQKWMNHKGVTRDRFPEFVQEVVFRYNHRSADLYTVILRKISLMPPPVHTGS